MSWLDPLTVETISGGSESPFTSLGTLAGYQLEHNVTVADGDVAAVTQKILVASEIVRSVSGQEISPGTDTVWVTTGGSRVRLPQLPVVSVSSVTVDGDVWATPDQYTFEGGLISAVGSCFPCGAQRVEVTYTHGYAITPPHVLSIVYSLARRMFEGGDGRLINQESLGGYSVGYAATQPSGLTSMEEMIVRGLGWPSWVS